MKKELNNQTKAEILNTLKERFEKNLARHSGMDWTALQAKLEANPEKLWVLNQMELSGGEPHTIFYFRLYNT